MSQPGAFTDSSGEPCQAGAGLCWCNCQRSSAERGGSGEMGRNLGASGKAEEETRLRVAKVQE